jgi:hypothetical protein
VGGGREGREGHSLECCKEGGLLCEPINPLIDTTPVNFSLDPPLGKN